MLVRDKRAPDKIAQRAGESPPVLEGTRTAAVSSLSDRDLVRACREGSERAWTELVERFSRYVYAIATQAYRLADHDADDVFQEVFARTFQLSHRGPRYHAAASSAAPSRQIRWKL
jgi:hypothetical protein